MTIKLAIMDIPYVIDIMNTFGERLSTTVRICISIMGYLSYSPWVVLSLFRVKENELQNQALPNSVPQEVTSAKHQPTAPSWDERSNQHQPRVPTESDPLLQQRPHQYIN
jgi:hypothetical protein